MATVGEVSVRIEADTTRFQAAMNRVQTSMGKVSDEAKIAAATTGESFAKTEKSASSLGRRMQEVGSTVGIAFAAVGGAIAVGLGFAVKKAADFEQEISRVGAISGATKDDLQKLRETALRLGASTSKSASEVAKGMELMAASGFKTNEVIAAMPGIISAAEASGEDMATVTQVVTSALNSFGLKASEASRIADVLAQAANDSAANIDDMGYAFKYAAPLAKQVGISLEELAASVEIMSNAGIKGETAGTTLRMALIRLADPPKAAKKALEQLNVSVKDAQGNFLPFANIIGQLRTKLQGMSNAQKVAALSHIFGAEAVSGMLTIIDAGPEKLQKMTKSLQNSAGASSKAAQQMKDNLAGSLEQLQGAFETLQITIGTALTPAIRALANVLSSLVNAFNQLPKPVQSFLAIGAAVLSVLLIIGGVVALAAAGLGALATAFGATIGVVVAWVGGILGGIAVIFAIGAALVYAYNKFAGFRAVVNAAWQAIKNGFQAVITYLQPAVTAVATFINQQWTKIKAWWDANGPTILQAIRNVFNFIMPIIQIAMNTIIPILRAAWNTIVTIIQVAWSLIKIIVSGVISQILNIISLFANILTGNWSAAWGNVKNILSTAWNSMKAIVNTIIRGIYNIIASELRLIWTVVRSIWSGIRSTVSTYLNAIISTVRSVWNSAKTTISNAVNSIKTSISNGFNTAKQKVSSIVTSIQTSLSGMAKSALEWGKNLINSFADGIESAGKKVVEKVKAIAAEVKSYLGFSSPTEKGPGSTSHHWAPNLMSMFSKGIQAGIPNLRMAVTQAATVTSELQGSGSSGSTSISPTINVYSQKAVLKPRDLVREFDRVRWLGGGR